MNRITSASGTTSGANVDIVPLMRAMTSLNGTEDQFYPFRPRELALTCNLQTNIFTGLNEELFKT